MSTECYELGIETAYEFANIIKDKWTKHLKEYWSKGQFDKIEGVIKEMEEFNF